MFHCDTISCGSVLVSGFPGLFYWNANLLVFKNNLNIWYCKSVPQVIFFIKKKLYIFIDFFGREACRILVPQLGIKTVPLVMEAQSPNHWTSWEVSPFSSFSSPWHPPYVVMMISVDSLHELIFILTHFNCQYIRINGFFLFLANYFIAVLDRKWVFSSPWHLLVLVVIRKLARRIKVILGTSVWLSLPFC